MGSVARGAQYTALLSEIEAGLKSLVHPMSGEPVVEDVYFPGLLFKGPNADHLPDVSVVWNAKAPIHAVTSPTTGLIRGLPDPQRSGNHRPEGFALFRGPSCAAGVGLIEGDGRQMPATVLKLFGIAPPAHYEKTAAWFVGRKGVTAPYAA
jgi:hypothetical protein